MPPSVPGMRDTPGRDGSELRPDHGAVRVGTVLVERVVALRQVAQRDPDKPVNPRLTNNPISTVIAQAKPKFPQHASKLDQVPQIPDRSPGVRRGS
jgi:hypothetical protein